MQPRGALGTWLAISALSLDQIRWICMRLTKSCPCPVTTGGPPFCHQPNTGPWSLLDGLVAPGFGGINPYPRCPRPSPYSQARTGLRGFLLAPVVCSYGVS
ncbi:hypothetical protein F4775DRAFT_298626 [Biscogniauxia sp. FL1348]|nr:hypothetical protein F4775DRAFT_298626 [Biscogniauxia sp. FL1348]